MFDTLKKFRWLHFIFSDCLVCVDVHVCTSSFFKLQDGTHLIYFVSSVILLFLFMLIVAIVLSYHCLLLPMKQ